MLKTLAWAGVAAMAVGANGNWNLTVTQTEDGHQIGNPDAELKLIEFVSYTCPHCAHFAAEGERALHTRYIEPGKVSVEVRHIIRDPVDLTATILANCGPASKFPQNHAALMHSQGDWLPILAQRTPQQTARWTSGDYASRRRAIAADFGFYELMERRGYSRDQVEACLADNAAAEALSQASIENGRKYHVAGTPSFAINGITLVGTHDWRSLATQLDARLKQGG